MSSQQGRFGVGAVWQPVGHLQGLAGLAGGGARLLGQPRRPVFETVFPMGAGLDRPACRQYPSGGTGLLGSGQFVGNSSTVPAREKTGFEPGQRL
jgi:hypothetical protein